MLEETVLHNAVFQERSCNTAKIGAAGRVPRGALLRALSAGHPALVCFRLLLPRRNSVRVGVEVEPLVASMPGLSIE